jgi:protein gp37
MADVCYHCGGGETTAARQRVFCASLSDWLDEEVPIDWLADLLDLIRRTPHLDWLLLTKRPQDWQARLDQVRCERLTTPEHGTVCRDLIIPWLNGYVPPNLWIGTTVEDQTRVDQRIPELLKIPARVRFLSCEPLLGPVDLSMWLDLFMTYPVRHTPEGPGSFVRTGPIEWKPSPPSPFGDSRDEIHWVITGGESGPKARPMHPDWARSLREQCVAAGLPFLFKQWGEWLPITPVYDGHDEEYMDGTDPDRIEVLRMDGSIWPWTSGQPPLEGCPWFVERVGKKAAGRLLDGEEHNTFPEGGAK